MENRIKAVSFKCVYHLSYAAIVIYGPLLQVFALMSIPAGLRG